METFTYEPPTIPFDYYCSRCGLGGMRLWRQYNVFADHVKLLCVYCATEEEGEPIRERYGRGSSDQIGWLVPAVPTEDGVSFWGYSSVPEPGVDWWHALPVGYPHEPKPPKSAFRKLLENPVVAKLIRKFIRV